MKINNKALLKTLQALLKPRFEYEFDQSEDLELWNWQVYLLGLKKDQGTWCESLMDYLGLLEEISDKCILACQENRSNIVSHRDLGPKNTMWIKEGFPMVIDWEASGSVNYRVELLEVALS